MARLNETAQPTTESIDALKRRFVRQNREIAKANSTQSLRIRNLEGEVSRLLGENVCLREQIIKLHYESESDASQLFSSQVDSFKAKLETKLSDVRDLVEELGQAQRNAKKKDLQKRKSLSRISSPKRSPNQRIWKNTQTLSELMGEVDGRLPPIVEDKHFPRQTLDSDELHAISADPANLTDSPDLGPPPVAHFEEGEPIDFDARESRRASKTTLVAAESSEAPFSANLETRRRRRESIHSKDTSAKVFNSEAAKSESGTQTFGESSHAVKAGAKRKLNVRDENEQPLKQSETDDFQFERKDASKPLADKASKTASSKLSERPSSRTERSRDASKEIGITVSLTGRRALGPKSANTDPQSPAKAKLLQNNVKAISSRDILTQKIREKDQQRERPRAKTPVEPVKSTAQISKAKEPDMLASREPETPAPPSLDLFSPTSTEPSARQEGRGDTPPPPELGQDTGTGSYGRASRRSRGSVSYAEPSLRDKMRRPTKELVDAVGAEERAKQARAMKLDSIESALTKVKAEDDGTEPLPNWRTMPVRESHAEKERLNAEITSPLDKKATAPTTNLPASVITDRKRRISIMSRTDNDSEPPNKSKTSAVASSTVAALAKPKRGQDHQSDRREEEEKEDINQGGGGSQRRQSDRTSIFDFTGSSPEPKGKTTTSEQHEEVIESKPSSSRSTTNTARRHSSVPALSDHGKGSLAILRRTRRESVV